MTKATTMNDANKVEAGKPLSVKVCGMREAANIRAVAGLQPHKPDWMGFIFYDKSPRFVSESLDVLLVRSLRHEPFNIRTVGVFVNANEREILRRVEQLDLFAVQLHGDESPDYCSRIKPASGLCVIKAFNIASKQDIERIAAYEGVIDYALFDTKTAQPNEYGGSGTRFDWSVLDSYNDSLPFCPPFFLSGGVDPHSADEIKRLSNPHLAVVDINSRFELSAGVKDMRSIQAFIERLYFQ